MLLGTRQFGFQRSDTRRHLRQLLLQRYALWTPGLLICFRHDVNIIGKQHLSE